MQINAHNLTEHQLPVRHSHPQNRLCNNTGTATGTVVDVTQRLSNSFTRPFYLNLTALPYYH